MIPLRSSRSRCNASGRIGQGGILFARVRRRFVLECVGATHLPWPHASRSEPERMRKAMTRQLRSSLAWLLILLTVAPGCHPIQPFYLHEDGDLSHYIERATEIEHPDVYEPILAGVANTAPPLTLGDPRFDELWDLTLEEVVSIALQNSKVIRNLGGITPFGFSDGLIGRLAGATTIFDTGIVESDPQNGVEAALSAFDAQLSMLGSNNGNLLSQTDRRSRFAPGNAVQFDTGGVRTELSKRTASGLQLSLRNQTDYTRGNTDLGVNQALPSIWETFFEVEARYPLLRGRGAQINRIPVILARINTDVSLASFEASVRNMVLDIENTYWDLHCAYRQLETAMQARDAAQLTWHSVAVQKQEGVSDTPAEAQAREQFFFFRAQLESALRTLYDQENGLRFLMGLEATDGPPDSSDRRTDYGQRSVRLARDPS